MSNVQTARQYLLKRSGLAPHQVDGIVGNLMQESGPSLKTTAVGDGGNSYGVAQWNGPRRRALFRYAKDQGAEPSSLKVQLDFLLHELGTTEKAAASALMNTRTAADAARVFSDKFERPGVPHIERRVRFAEILGGRLDNAEGGAPAPDMRIAGGDGMDAIIQEMLRDGGIEKTVNAEIKALDPALRANSEKAADQDRVDGFALDRGAGMFGAPERANDGSALEFGADFLLNGLTLGNADRVKAVTGAALGGTGEESFGEEYNRLLADERAKLARRREEYPITAGVVEAVGMVPTALVPGGPVANTLRGKMAQGAATGAAMGAVAGEGFGDGETLGQRLDDATFGATGGAVLGGAIPALGAAVGPVLNAGRNAIRSMRAGPRQTNDMAAVKVQEALAADGRTLDNVLARRVPGKPDTLMDLGGDTTRRLARDVWSFPGPASAQMDEFLTQRVNNQAARIERDIAEFSGRKPGEFSREAADIAARRQAQAGPLYDDLRRQSMVAGDDFQALANTPAMKQAMRKAVTDMRNARHPDADRMAAMVQAGDFTGQRLPFTFVDKTKQSLDSFISSPEALQGASSIRRGSNRSMTGVKDDLLAVADAGFPKYARARKIFSDEMSVEDALKAGRSFAKGDSEDLGQAFSALSQAEKDAFYAGFAREIRTMTERGREQANAAAKLVDVKDMRRRFFALKPSAADFKKLMRQLRRESSFANTRNTVARGSQTKEGQTAAGRFAKGLGDVVELSIQGGTTQIPGRILQRLSEIASNRVAMSPKVANRVAELLTSRDVGGIVQFLRSTEGRRALLNRGVIDQIPPKARQALSRVLTAKNAESVGQDVWTEILRQWEVAE